MVASNTTSRYYVRMNGKIRGPFDTERLRSMRKRNRIGSRDELSVDRRKWVLAGAVSEVFPEGFADIEPNPDASDWYYMTAGQQQGPLALAAMQSLAQSGGLAPHDSVWRLGTPGWVLASQVPELAFAPTRSWWQSQHQAIRLGIVAAGLLLFMVPIWMVFSYYKNQTNAAREHVRQQIENEKWLAEQKQVKEMHEAEQKQKKELSAEEQRLKKEMHQEMVKRLADNDAAAQRRHDQQMYAAQQAKYRVGEKVGAGSGLASFVGGTWRGIVVEYRGNGWYRVKIMSCPSCEEKYAKFNYREGNTYDIRESEIEFIFDD